MIRTKGPALFALVACAAALAVAQGSERWLGLVPCAFCLLERRPYQVGVGLAVLALILPTALSRRVGWVIVLVMLLAVGLSTVHVGVEQHWWPDPLPACTVPDFTGMTAGQRLMAMPARPAKPCEDPDFLIPGLPVSMSQMALIYAVTASAFLALTLSRQRIRRFR